MTLKRNPANERVKRRYLQFLRDVKGRDETSLDAVAKAIERFDEYNRRRDFKKFQTYAERQQWLQRVVNHLRGGAERSENMAMLNSVKLSR
jgi:hypothetical protein